MLLVLTTEQANVAAIRTVIDNAKAKEIEDARQEAQLRISESVLAPLGGGGGGGGPPKPMMLMRSVSPRAAAPRSSCECNCASHSLVSNASRASVVVIGAAPVCTERPCAVCCAVCCARRRAHRRARRRPRRRACRRTGGRRRSCACGSQAVHGF